MLPPVHCPYIRRRAVFCRQAPQTLTHMEVTLMPGYSRYHAYIVKLRVDRLSLLNIAADRVEIGVFFIFINSEVTLHS